MNTCFGSHIWFKGPAINFLVPFSFFFFLFVLLFCFLRLLVPSSLTNRKRKKLRLIHMDIQFCLIIHVYTCWVKLKWIKAKFYLNFSNIFDLYFLFFFFIFLIYKNPFRKDKFYNLIFTIFRRCRNKHFMLVMYA